MLFSRIRRATLTRGIRPNVQRLEARDVPATFTVINTLDAGPGSLRQAILSANASPDPTDTVVFNIPSLGVATIQPLTELPAPGNGVSIDATTQPGYIVGTPVIELDGSLAAPGSNGLTLSSSSVTVRGLIINRFPNNGINVNGATNTQVTASWIGLDNTGFAIAENGGIAVSIEGSSTIPVTFRLGGPNEADRNVIVDNNDVVIAGGAVSGPVIQNNFIGTDRSGTFDLTTNISGSQAGIQIAATAGKFDITSNVISGMSGYGIFGQAGSQDTLVRGNIIGLAADGVTVIRNGKSGVFLASTTNWTIGGTSSGDRNIISGNGFDDGASTGNGAGVTIDGTSANNLVIGNLIGTDKNGTTLFNNFQAWGVELLGSVTGNTIGQVGAGNVFGGNGHAVRNFGAGVLINDNAANNKVQGNFVGVLADGTTAAANLFHGIQIGSKGGGNVVGGALAGQGNLIIGNGTGYGAGLVSFGGSGFEIRGNVISGSKNGGIQLDGASDVTIAGNIVGLAADGVTALANNGHGIDGYNGCSTITIGGPNLADRNIFSLNDQGIRFDGGNTFQIQNNYFGVDKTGTLDLGNKGSGVFLFNVLGGNIVGNLSSGNGGDGVALDNSSGLTITGNIFGLDATGTTVINNSFSGVAMFNGSSSNTIGGPAVGDRNILSGNGAGVYIGGGNSQFNLVVNNYIGVDISGVKAAGNTFRGVFFDQSANNELVGNVVAASTNEGIVVGGNSASGNKIRGNLIGTDSTGLTALPNGVRGIGVYSGVGNLTIGGANPGDGNVISGNKGSGIELYDPGTNNITIQGNWIGTDKSGTVNLGNEFNGIVVSNVLNATIGGVNAGEANVIAFNKANGVTVFDNTSGASIRGNSIYSNTLLGVDLGNDGPTANDVQDPDIGPNLLQNFPVLTTASAGANTSVAGSLNSIPLSVFTVDFYANDAGGTQGKRYLGSDTVTTDAAGNASFSLTTLGASTGGEVITALAVDSANNTSEFSAGVTAVGAAAPAKVTALVINNGAAQRSRVLSVRLDFDQIVTITGGLNSAFSLKRVSDNAAVTFDTVNSIVDNSGPGTKVTFVFSLSGPTDGGVGNVSLADGRYILTADASKISNANGDLDGDGNGSAGGNYVSVSTPYLPGPPAVAPTGIFRLFGDGDGNGTVDSSDFLSFRLAFLSMNNVFDFDGNGTVDPSDFLAFRLNFLKVVV